MSVGRRTITDFHPDEAGDWVAELDCLHGQQVRHNPPFLVRPWVLTEVGRDERLGSAVDCPLCDRAEMPLGLRRVRQAGPFDAGTLPPGLRATHVVADRTWGCLRVLEGTARLVMATEPPTDVEMVAGGSHAIPPGVAHSVSPGDAAVITLEFLTR